MDNSLKLLIAVLGIAGTLAMVVPSAVNMSESDGEVVKPLESSEIPPPSTPKPELDGDSEQPGPEDEETSDEDGVADFGKPMIDPRPAGEQMSQPTDPYAQPEGELPQPGYGAYPGYAQPVPGYGPPQGYPVPGNYGPPEPPSEPAE